MTKRLYKDGMSVNDLIKELESVEDKGKTVQIGYYDPQWGDNTEDIAVSISHEDDFVTIR